MGIVLTQRVRCNAANMKVKKNACVIRMEMYFGCFGYLFEIKKVQLLSLQEKETKI